MMNILAKILSHGFAIAVVVLLALGYLYRGELFPEYDVLGWLGIDSDETAQSTAAAPVDAGVDAAATGGVAEADAVPATPGEPAAEAPEAEAPEAEAPEAEAPAAEAPAAAEPVTSEPVTAESGAEKPAEPTPDSQEKSPDDAGLPAPVPAGEAAAPVEEPAVEEGAGQAERTGEAGDVPGSMDSPAAAVPVEVAPELPGHRNAYQKLADAREAFWLRDYEAAEVHYQALIALEPGNPDGYGELGNMYFSRGAWEEAASAYYEAGMRLVEQGLVEEAEQLVQVIRGLDGAQADELDAAIRHAGTTTP